MGKVRNKIIKINNIFNIWRQMKSSVCIIEFNIYIFLIDNWQIVKKNYLLN